MLETRATDVSFCLSNEKQIFSARFDLWIHLQNIQNRGAKYENRKRNFMSSNI